MTARVRDAVPADQGDRLPGGLRVLLVEDHRDSAEAIAAVLRMWGHEPYLAASVAEALAIAGEVTGRGDPLDLAICDIGLPDGNGWELMRRLGEGFGLPGIAVTALSSPLDRERSAAAGFSHHLVKPLSLEELESALAMVDRAPDPRRGFLARDAAAAAKRCSGGQ